MGRFVVAGTEDGGYIPVGPPDSVVASTTQILGSRMQVEVELDAMNVMMKQFWAMQPDEVMRQVAAFSARLTELSVLLHRIEGRDRQFKQIRTLQVGPMLAECDRQFKLASRIVEVRRQDLETAKGFI